LTNIVVLKKKLALRGLELIFAITHTIASCYRPSSVHIARNRTKYRAHSVLLLGSVVHMAT